MILKNDIIGYRVMRIFCADQSTNVTVVPKISGQTYVKIAEGDDIVICAGKFLVVPQLFLSSIESRHVA